MPAAGRALRHVQIAVLREIGELRTQLVETGARAFTSLEFPATPDGVATVVYPLAMQPE